MSDRELLQQALEVMEDAHYNKEHKQDEGMRINAIGAIRARLAKQPEERSSDIEQEPVAWLYVPNPAQYPNGWKATNVPQDLRHTGTHNIKPLYTTPQPTAQPEQEPVEYQILILGQRWAHCAKHLYDPANPAMRALYTAPQPAAQPVPLTDERIEEMYYRCRAANPSALSEVIVSFARAIEAAHGIK